ncbi:MAG: hypothetical protein OEY49_12605 [Candidatus Heimdallarchaeota archaeon]|nr:hypothetical protein [Candidatus Heimdallarchaeota archaeon]
MKKYVVCGLGPSKLGVGRLVDSLIHLNKLHEFGYEFIYNPTPNLKNKVLEVLLKSSLLEKALRIFHFRYSTLKISFKIRKIKDSKVLIIHPQSLGFNNFFKLIKNNICEIYIVDNSYFCLKSYNQFKNEFNACLRCLSSRTFVEASNCSPYPFPYSRNENIKNLIKWTDESNSISYLVQNQNQASLLMKHFGREVSIKVVGLYTTEFDNHPSMQILNDHEYDIVYHGSILKAKGFLYFCSLIMNLKKFRILIPFSPSIVKEQYKNIDSSIFSSENISFINMTWESGLQQVIEKCKLVVCPSLWSAPIEGAIIKSILHNGCVAIYNAHYSFSNELPENIVVKLGENLDKSAAHIENILLNTENRKILINKSKEWYKNYIIESKNLGKGILSN